jgi:hypothetical protein
MLTCVSGCWLCLDYEGALKFLSYDETDESNQKLIDLQLEMYLLLMRKNIYPEILRQLTQRVIEFFHEMPLRSYLGRLFSIPVWKNNRREL